MLVFSIWQVCVTTFLSTILISGCRKPNTLTPGEGYALVGSTQVWYRVVGGGERTPMLLLHGGPGVPSYYLDPISDLASDRPVILFDQPGCGRSGNLSDTTAMTIEHYVEQLDQFIDALGLDRFYLYGHSWGSMLGIDYYLTHPDKVKAMILSSPLMSARMWADDAKELIATLPDSIQEDIRNCERREAFDAPEYLEAIEVYYKNFVARRSPYTPDLDSAFSRMNSAVYNFMWGPSEFTARGNLRNYDRLKRLPEVEVPVLFMTGEFDEARPSTVQYYHSLVPGSHFRIVGDAAHYTMHDQQEENNRIIREFLVRLEER